MHDEDKYLDSLYCIQDKIKKDAVDFAKTPENLQGKGVEYFDTLMHMAKNLRKEILAEEGMYGEEEYDWSGGNQTYGRAIRTTPGLSYEGQNGSQRGSMRSMRGMRRSYDGGMNGGNSGKRDARGRYSRAEGGEDVYEKLRRHANMTTDHDDRERMLTLIDWIESEN